MPFKETHIEVGGSKTKLLRGGSGEPLLYLHSAGSETMWMPFHEALAERYEVFAPAHPGFDTSQGLEKIDSMEDLVFHYLDFIDGMGWDKVRIVGLSLGGWIAAEFATRWSNRVKKLVLVDSAGLHVQGAPIAPMWEHAREPEYLRKIFFADPEGPLAMTLIMHPEEMPEEMLLLSLKAAEATARVGWNPYLHNPKLRGRLHRIKTPTLVLWGDKDGLIPPAHGRVFAEGIPGAKLLIIPNCGHIPPIEAQDAFVKHVLGFLEG